MALLKVENIGIRFGGLAALQEASFSLKPGEILAVIGPNGAGKTTLFNIITGIYKATDGSIRINNRSPVEEFNFLKAISLILKSFLATILFFAVINVESLWQAIITSNYIYQEKFQWQNITPNLSNFWDALSWQASYGTLLFGFFIALAANWAMWNRLSPEIVMKHGLARTFQNIRIFSKMSVLDNILVGMYSTLKNSKIGEKEAKQRAIEILKFVGLEKSIDLNADKLSYGHQRRLEIARALATNPKLILLDEPAAGMNPVEAVELMNLIKQIRDQGISVLLIEHHMKVVMGISDKIVVLNYGEKIAEGTPEEIRENPEVIKAYLGA